MLLVLLVLLVMRLPPLLRWRLADAGRKRLRHGPRRVRHVHQRLFHVPPQRAHVCGKRSRQSRQLRRAAGPWCCRRRSRIRERPLLGRGRPRRDHVVLMGQIPRHGRRWASNHAGGICWGRRWHTTIATTTNMATTATTATAFWKHNSAPWQPKGVLAGAVCGVPDSKVPAERQAPSAAATLQM